MKLIIAILFSFLCLFTKAQQSITKAQQSITKYYDEKWSVCPKEKAMYYAIFLKEGDLYKCTSYWIDSNIVSGKSIFPDTTMTHPIGFQVLYYKNGHIADSSLYTNEGIAIERLVYYENRQLALHYYKPEDKGKEIIEAYEKNGEKIDNYIYEKEAEFKGGQKAWVTYIQKNAGKFYSSDDKESIIEVKVQFIVNANGYTSNAIIKKSSGIKEIDADAIRLILSSPQWNNSIQYNRSVKAFRLAPISYELKPQRKRKTNN